MLLRLNHLPIVAAALALLAGCGGTDDMIAEDPLSGGRLTLAADKGEYGVGEPIELTFEVKNGTASRTYEFSSTCWHDFEVRLAGEMVWSAGWERICNPVLTSLDLAPGETWTVSEIWDQKANDDDPVGPGIYEAVAVLTRMGQPLQSNSLEIVIE